MSGLDDDGVVVLTCPLCEAWQVDVDIRVIGWPLAGELVEEACAEHVDEHVQAARIAQVAGRDRSRRALLGDGGLGGLGGLGGG